MFYCVVRFTRAKICAAPKKLPELKSCEFCFKCSPKFLPPQKYWIMLIYPSLVAGCNITGLLKTSTAVYIAGAYYPAVVCHSFVYFLSGYQMERMMQFRTGIMQLA
jgi:hypothetical protein